MQKKSNLQTDGFLAASDRILSSFDILWHVAVYMCVLLPQWYAINFWFIHITITSHRRQCVSNHRQFNVCKLTTKKTSKLRTAGLCEDSSHNVPAMQRAFPCHVITKSQYVTIWLKSIVVSSADSRVLVNDKKTADILIKHIWYAVTQEAEQLTPGFSIAFIYTSRFDLM